MSVRYFKLNEDLEVVEVAENYKALPTGDAAGPKMWAKQPVGEFKPGCEFTLGAGWIERWDFPSLEFAEKLAASVSKLTAEEWLPIDQGPSVSPRYDVMPCPAVGDDASKGFNGDYYPVGKVVAVSPAPARRIITVDGPRGKLRFYRRGLSAGWIQAGGTWGLVRGVVERMNPEY